VIRRSSSPSPAMRGARWRIAMSRASDPGEGELLSGASPVDPVPCSRHQTQAPIRDPIDRQYQYGVDSEIVKDSTGNYHVLIDADDPGQFYYWWHSGSRIRPPPRATSESSRSSHPNPAHHLTHSSAALVRWYPSGDARCRPPGVVRVVGSQEGRASPGPTSTPTIHPRHTAREPDRSGRSRAGARLTPRPYK